MPHRTLHEILRYQELLFITPDTSVLMAAMRMSDRNVAAVLVIEAGELKGIFTERDMLRRVITPGLTPAETTVADVMSTDLVTVDAGRAGYEAVRMMYERGVRHAVVTGLASDPPYGIISIRDFPPRELASFERAMAFEHQLWEEI